MKEFALDVRRDNKPHKNVANSFDMRGIAYDR
jgi:hypothetical protein